jgi:hypothetical protein
VEFVRVANSGHNKPEHADPRPYDQCTWTILPAVNSTSSKLSLSKRMASVMLRGILKVPFAEVLP